MTAAEQRNEDRIVALRAALSLLVDALDDGDAHLIAIRHREAKAVMVETAPRHGPTPF